MKGIPRKFDVIVDITRSDSCWYVLVGVNYWIEGGEAPSRDSPGEEAFIDWDEVIDLETGQDIASELDEEDMKKIEEACWANYEHRVQHGYFESDGDIYGS